MEISKKRTTQKLSDFDKAYELSALIHADSFFYALFDSKSLIISDEIDLKDLSFSVLYDERTYDISKAKIAVLNNNFTIIPAKEYDSNISREMVIHACGSLMERGHIFRADFNKEANVYICYAVRSELLDFCMALHKIVSIHHIIDILISQVKSTSERQLIHLCRLGNQTVIIASEYGKLKLVNAIGRYQPLTLLYYATLLKESFNFSDQLLDIRLSGDFQNSDGVARLLSKYFRHVDYEEIVLNFNGLPMSGTSVFFPLQSVSQCA